MNGLMRCFSNFSTCDQTRTIGQLMCITIFNTHFLESRVAMAGILYMIEVLPKKSNRCILNHH